MQGMQRIDLALVKLAKDMMGYPIE